MRVIGPFLNRPLNSTPHVCVESIDNFGFFVRVLKPVQVIILVLVVFARILLGKDQPVPNRRLDGLVYFLAPWTEVNESPRPAGYSLTVIDSRVIQVREIQ